MHQTVRMNNEPMLYCALISVNGISAWYFTDSSFVRPNPVIKLSVPSAGGQVVNNCGVSAF